MPPKKKGGKKGGKKSASPQKKKGDSPAKKQKEPKEPTGPQPYKISAARLAALNPSLSSLNELFASELAGLKPVTSRPGKMPASGRELPWMGVAPEDAEGRFRATMPAFPLTNESLDFPGIARCWRCFRLHFSPAPGSSPDTVGVVKFTQFGLFDWFRRRGEGFPGGFPYDERKWRTLIMLINRACPPSPNGLYFFFLRQPPREERSPLLRALVPSEELLIEPPAAPASPAVPQSELPGGAGTAAAVGAVGPQGPLELLLEEDPHLVDAPDERGESPLSIAVAQGISRAVFSLLRAGAFPSSPGRDGNTPLHRAAVTGHTDVVEALLAAGGDPRATNVYGESVIHVASRAGTSEVVKRLVEAGASADTTTTRGGFAPTHYAAASGHLPVLTFLDKTAKASMQVLTVDRHTPLIRAAAAHAASVVMGAAERTADIQATVNYCAAWKPPKAGGEDHQKPAKGGGGKGKKKGKGKGKGKKK